MQPDCTAHCISKALEFKFPIVCFLFVCINIYVYICFPSRTFSPTKPAKSLHTQKNRQFFHEPEENFWMVMVLMHVICIFLKHYIAMFSMHSALSNTSLFHVLGCTESDNRKTQRWKASLWISGRRITGNTELFPYFFFSKWVSLYFKSTSRNMFDSSWTAAKLILYIYIYIKTP